MLVLLLLIVTRVWCELITFLWKWINLNINYANNHIILEELLEHFLSVGLMCWNFKVFVITRANHVWMHWSLRFACEMPGYRDQMFQGRNHWGFEGWDPLNISIDTQLWTEFLLTPNCGQCLFEMLFFYFFVDQSIISRFSFNYTPDWTILSSKFFWKG